MYRVVVAAALLLALLVDDAHAQRLYLTNRSISCGSPNRGKLYHGITLPDRGQGYVIPGMWGTRNYSYGTVGLVQLLQRVTKSVDIKYPGAILGIGDLSRKNGGTVWNHASHQAGRDVDLHYYALDRQNRPFKPDKFMPVYTYTGRASYTRRPFVRVPERFFDLKRNWALVKALLTDSRVHVTRIFASYRIKKWLIKYAKQTGESPTLITRAIRTIMQPSDGRAHSDHMHVRIACTVEDTRLGRCRDHSWPISPRLKKRLIEKRGKVRLYFPHDCPFKTNS